MKYKKEFKESHPETVGETDSHFDMSNYVDWIDKKVETLEKRSVKLDKIENEYYRAVEIEEDPSEQICNIIEGF